ncbi:unnamed protein product, partial [Choristocarpus tenellus]
MTFNHVKGVRDFETYFEGYRVRPKRLGECIENIKGACTLFFSGEDEDLTEDSFVQGLANPEFLYLHFWTTNSSLDILVVEDVKGDASYVGFCGAIPQGGNLNAYVCTQKEREIDSKVADLLVRALRGWILGSSVVQEDYCDANPGEELVDWISTDGHIICTLPRAMVHTHNILHRGAGILVQNDQGEVYCHRRTATKRLFPSMYDMFIGGISGTGESPEQTALRELREELGLGLHPERLERRLRCIVSTEYNRCLVEVFDYLPGPEEVISWQEEEVTWGAYLGWDEVREKVESGDWEFVPDGLQVWEHYLKW